MRPYTYIIFIHMCAEMAVEGGRGSCVWCVCSNIETVWRTHPSTRPYIFHYLPINKVKTLVSTKQVRALLLDCIQRRCTHNCAITNKYVQHVRIMYERVFSYIFFGLQMRTHGLFCVNCFKHSVSDDYAHSICKCSICVSHKIAYGIRYSVLFSLSLEMSNAWMISLDSQVFF